MDIDNLIKRLDTQDDQIKSLKKTVTALSNQLSSRNEELSDLTKLQKSSKKEIDRISAAIMSLGKFDSSLSQIRMDFARALEEQEKTRKLTDSYREKIRQDDQLAQTKALEKIRTDLQSEMDGKIRAFMDESQKTFQHIKEMEHKLGAGLRSEEAFRDTISSLQQDIRQQAKKLESVDSDSKSHAKDLEGVWPKIELLLDQLRKNESRLVEMQSIENQRRQDQNIFIEQQNLRQLESSRQFKEWNQQLQDIVDRSKVLLEEYSTRVTELRVAQQDFSEINERLERRINEITEMYRLLDERVRQNWDAYKAEDQKKWAGINLLSGERQESLIQQFESMKERLAQVEDANHELYDTLVLMSSEFQKGMQGLMKTFNGLMDSFGNIKPGTSTIKR